MLKAVFLLVAGLGYTLSFLLFSCYRTKEAKYIRWTRAWQFSPDALGGFSNRSLILISLAGLFLELLMIRWISSEIRIFAYFKNFVLIACYLGFGLGCALCRRRINLLAMLAPLMLLALFVTLPWEPLRKMVSELPDSIGAFSSVHIWSVPAMSFTQQSTRQLLGAIAIIVPLFAFITLVFMPVGQLVGWYLEKAANGIAAYTTNVLASLAGILLYTLLCFAYQPPAAWFAIGGVLLTILFWKSPVLRWSAIAAFGFCIALAAISPGKDKTVFWSPYQKLTLTNWEDGHEVVGYNVNTNDSWYQVMINLSPQFVAGHQRLLRGVPIEWNAYNLPYRFHPDPPSVLVLGAGTGNDVAAAVRNGAARVVAVEIDPLILDQGRRLHFEKPYDSPRVQTVVDDARSYLQNGKEQFSLILFSLLDSHTTSSYFSNIRIDNYVYTVEALAAARRLLKPDGLFIVKFWVDRPWIAGRLHGLLTKVFGHPPVQLEAEPSYTTEGSFFVTGSEAALARAMSDPGLSGYVRQHGNIRMQTARLTTDDWPYFYQQEPGLPISVLLISLVLALVCWWAIRETGSGGRWIEWHFFFLGAAFLLLEAQIISKMALLFGTTWLVNSIVIGALLLLIVGANVLVQWKPSLSIRMAYAGIFACIAISYAVPLETFFFESIWLKMLSSALVLCLPVFFAGIVFIRSFARAGFTGSALGSNLMGSLVGGLLESLSMWTGLKSLLLLAAVLYLASYFFMHQEAEKTSVEAEAISIPAT